MTEPTKTMSPALVALIEVFHTTQAAQREADCALAAAKAVVEEAEVAAKAATCAAKHAQTVMQAGFLQEVDPMPLIPAPRPDPRCWSLRLDACSIMGHRIDASMIVDDCC